jgi:hypothetical protein
MNIVIKGSKIPLICGDCHVCYYDEVKETEFCSILGQEFGLNEKLPDCPIVGEFPSVHGRLIDADWLSKVVSSLLKEDAKRSVLDEVKVEKLIEWFKHILKAAPTVLEASEERE